MGRSGAFHQNMEEQPSPDGLAQAYMLAEEHLNGSPSLL